jgi:3-deoxy-D-manno-octulosonate 8-phosphate phosphatase (KDO 8-P phosphatase)
MHYRVPLEDVALRATRITHLFLDCDGVLTDGSIFLLPDGDEVKRFNTVDGHGIVLWRRVGHTVGIISGRGSSALEHRVRQLGIEYLVQRTMNKLESFTALVEEQSISPEEIAYMGDDVVDIPLMTRVGLAAAPADAVPEAIEAAHVVTGRRGGHGAVREFIDMLLKQQGQWDELMKRYLS